MPSLLDSPPQIPAAGAGAGAWASLYDAQEPALKPAVPAAAAAKKPAACSGGGGGRKKKHNLETCTEALGCETGAVDAAPDAEMEAECAERKRRGREEEAGEVTEGGRARRPLPPPLTTLARGATRVRLVHERRDGRLAVYAVRAPGVEAERSGGRLRMRLVSSGHPTAGCRRQEPREAAVAEEEAAVEEAKAAEEECGVAMYVRGGRCAAEPEGAAAAAARCGKQWEQEQAAAFWVATS